MGLDETTQAAINITKDSERLLASRLSQKLSPKAVREGTRKYFREEAQPILDVADPFHISHNVLRRIERKGLSVRRGLSFRANMLEMSESRKLGLLRPSWALDEKNSAYSFLDELGVRRPASDSLAYTWDEIDPQFPSVIKATKSTGARGCYLVFSPEKIVHVSDHATFDSWQEMDAHARRLMNPSGSQRTGLPDRWMVEELVLENSRQQIAARNLKFYCFYGEILFVQESRREPELEVCFYTPDNAPVVTGRYEDLVFEGVGVSPDQVETVRRISREIPHPFMRIDMLNGEDEIVFGEFTPRPGNFNEFNEYWDRKMGEAWVRAESEILRDLLSGKTFDSYLESTGLLRTDKKQDPEEGVAGG